MTVAGKKNHGTRPRDASMSLLNNIFAQPLDPGYQQAAARREQDGDPGGRSRVSLALVVGMLALGMLLAVAILQAQGTASVISAEREGLIERIRVQEEQVERLSESMDSLQAEISELEDTLLRQSATGQQLRDRLQLLRSAAGTMPVSGPGVAVVLDDAEDVEAAENPQLARVLDLDLQLVVNGLWMAGAEAISINGQRLTALSGIRGANNMIHVNHQPLKPPYAVWAIGDSRTLPSRFSENDGGDSLRGAASHGVRYAVRAEEVLELPAANPSLAYAESSEEVP